MLKNWFVALLSTQIALARASMRVTDVHRDQQIVSRHTGLDARSDLIPARAPQIFLVPGSGITIKNFKDISTGIRADFSGPGIKASSGLGMNPVVGWKINFMLDGKLVEEECDVFKMDSAKPQLEDQIFAIQASAEEAKHVPIGEIGGFVFTCGPVGLVSYAGMDV